jgi:hypothetical protein
MGVQMFGCSKNVGVKHCWGLLIFVGHLIMGIIIFGSCSTFGSTDFWGLKMCGGSNFSQLKKYWE